MGSRETALPLTRPWIARAVLVLWALALPTGVGAQPTDLFNCVADPLVPQCNDPLGPLTIAECSPDPPTVNLFETYRGRIAWYPLRCVGPITIEVLTYSWFETHFPLYVEVVPISNDFTEWWKVCENAAGSVILETFGRFNTTCGEWEEVGPIDITHVVSLGSLYALRLHFFDSRGAYSPALGCVRVTAHPSRTAVEGKTWGLVKALFR